MPLRQQIIHRENIEQFEKSAEEHYEDGFLLLSSGRVTGVDSMALAAEMLLKAAYFRYAGFPTTLTVTDADRQAAKNLAISLGVAASASPFHNLLFWVNAIIAVRGIGFGARTHSSGVALPVVAASPILAYEASLRAHATALRANWDIGDRYLARQGLATQADFDEVFDALVGILTLYNGNII